MAEGAGCQEATAGGLEVNKLWVVKKKGKCDLVRIVPLCRLFWCLGVWIICSFGMQEFVGETGMKEAAICYSTVSTGAKFLAEK